MSSVLRNKIQRAAGLPPSLAGNTVLWRNIMLALDGWSEKAFGGNGNFVLEARRVCSGPMITRALASFEVALFDAGRSPAIRAIALDQVTLTALAASRLGVQPAELADAPALLKQLAFVKQASALWIDLAHALPGQGAEVTPEPSLMAKASEGAFDPSGSYLIVNIASGETGDGLFVSVVFSLSGLMQSVASGEAGLAVLHNSDGVFSAALERAALDTSVEIDVVIDRLEMALADWFRLDVGATLVLDGAQDRMAGLEVTTSKGRVEIGTGSVGAWRNQRAIRLSSLSSRGDIRSGLAACLHQHGATPEEFSA